MAPHHAFVVLVGPGWKVGPVAAEGGHEAELCFGARWCVRDYDAWFWPMDLAVVRRWLLRKGFEASSDRRGVQRGCVETAIGAAPEIEVRLSEWGGGLSDIGVRFALTASSPEGWLNWAQVVSEVCAEWELRLVDPYRQCLIDGSEVLRVLEWAPQWREARARFDWPYLC